MNEYSFSAHGDSTELFPRHGGREVRLCIQCHDPHGKTEKGIGLIPSMLKEVEERGCLGSRKGGGGCHSADRGKRPVSAKDLESEHRKQYSHLLSRRTLWHKADEFTKTTAGQSSPSQRHVECVDCHNPHLARSGLHEEGTNLVSPVLEGSYGVRPLMWPSAGETVTHFEVKQFDPRRSGIDNLECYLCFRCHSYYSYGHTPPPDEEDMARMFNPNNASYHPVVERGKNRDIPSLLPPWTARSLMYCSDCHGSDEDPTERIPFGPHGSRHDYLLRRRYVADGGPSKRDDLCFLCHDPESYLAGGSRDGERASGFVADGRNLHLHEGHTELGCWSCHTVHGSPDFEHLLAVRDRQNRHSRIESLNIPNAGDYTLQSCGTIGEGGVSCHN